ncbi:hypothetical protein NQ318_009072 [Aromia moschata]|uniref:Uncharacterized protein n=1 Tax=Aromia moschata TaxID=1265417 RepID=A0AAV8YW19_9CUCU|nr:hypothetical protein NQ318_009072 [Aromia moschata]
MSLSDTQRIEILILLGCGDKTRTETMTLELATPELPAAANAPANADHIYYRIALYPFLRKASYDKSITLYVGGKAGNAYQSVTDIINFFEVTADILKDPNKSLIYEVPDLPLPYFDFPYFKFIELIKS